MTLPFRKALLTLTCLVVTTSRLPAQDPWARVPPFPTGCYASNTKFDTQISNLRQELVAAVGRQKSVNVGLIRQFNEMSPEAKRQKTLAFVTINPADAGSLLRNIGSSKEKDAKTQSRLNARLKALGAQFRDAHAAWDADYKAIEELETRLPRPVSEMRTGGDPGPARRLERQIDEAYERICAKHLKSESAPLLKYLADLKAFLVNEQVPAGIERDRIMKVQFGLFGIPVSNYRSTIAQSAVITYLDAMMQVFGIRKTRPVSGH